MSKPLVSVVTLVYKNFDSLQNTIESVYSQNYSNIEYIIGDDGSDNYNKDYILGMIDDKRVNVKTKVFHWEKNLGTVRNFNACIAESSGEYIIPLAADDSFYDSEVVAKIVNCFQNNNASVVTTKRLRDFDLGEGYIVPTKRQRDILARGDCIEIVSELLKSFFISGSCTSYSKSILCHYGGFCTDYRLIEDVPFYLRMLIDGYPIVLLDEICVHYGGNGVTTQKGAVFSLLQNDRREMYDQLVFPFIKRLPIYDRREITFRYYKNGLCKNKAKGYFMYIVYVDVVIRLGLEKMLRILKGRIENASS